MLRLNRSIQDPARDPLILVSEQGKGREETRNKRLKSKTISVTYPGPTDGASEARLGEVPLRFWVFDTWGGEGREGEFLIIPTNMKLGISRNGLSSGESTFLERKRADLFPMSFNTGYVPSLVCVMHLTLPHNKIRNTWGVNNNTRPFLDVLV